MQTHLVLAVVLSAVATPAFAQRVPFERSLPVNGPVTVDVSTIRGRIDVVVGSPARVVVNGDATVRVGWDVPREALAIARRVAGAPPIEQDGATIRLRPPSSDEERRAVTVAYRVTVPPDATVVAASDSGATSVRGVSGPVTVRTQSAAIHLGGLGSTASITTGSGAVSVDGVSGALIVRTSSSGVTGRDLRGAVDIRTQSGRVDAELAGAGDVSVTTGSSAISLRGVEGGVTAESSSGRVLVEGAPGAAWDVTTGSGAVEMTLVDGSAVAVDVSTASGSVRVDGAAVEGTMEKRRIVGRVNGGGPRVHARSRSGSILVKVAR